MTRTARAVVAVFSVVALATVALLVYSYRMKGLALRPWGTEIVHRGDAISEAARGEFSRTDLGEGAFLMVDRDGSSYFYSPRGHSLFLFFRDGRASAARYETCDVVTTNLSVRFPFDDPFLTLDVPCGGAASFDGREWTFRLTSPECSELNGTWQPRSAPPVNGDGGAACRLYHECVCDLALPLPELFGPTCEETRRLLDAAPDDPETCRGGLSVARRLALNREVVVPTSCEERSAP